MLNSNVIVDYSEKIILDVAFLFYIKYIIIIFATTKQDVTIGSASVSEFCDSVTHDDTKEVSWLFAVHLSIMEDGQLNPRVERWCTSWKGRAECNWVNHR